MSFQLVRRVVAREQRHPRTGMLLEQAGKRRRDRREVGAVRARAKMHDVDRPRIGEVGGRCRRTMPHRLQDACLALVGADKRLARDDHDVRARPQLAPRALHESGKPSPVSVR